MQLKCPIKGKLIYTPDGIISQKYNDPYTNKELLAYYKSLGYKGHMGIDFATFGGDNVYAAHGGKVVHASNDGNVNGNMTKIVWEEDGRFWGNVYGHQESILVSVGENVTTGQIIGSEGNSGSTPTFYMGVHLHFGLYEYKDDTYSQVINYNNGFCGAIDPLPYMTTNNMEYIIIGTEQFLYYEPFKMALNIGNEEVLRNLQLNGLTGTPVTKTSLPIGTKVYPLVNKEILADIFGLKS
jgi:murein DD-endopeptidase MepM/ murein hydrolase activator NlpD